MQAEPNFQTMSRTELMQYLEKDFDERALLELSKRPVPQSVIDEHNSFLKRRESAGERPPPRFSPPTPNFD